MNELLRIECDRLRFIGVTLNIKDKTPYIPTGITVVTGPNGCGKSTFGRILEGGWNFAGNRIVSPRGKLRVKMVEFNDIHSLTGCKAEYYQQRFEATMNEEVPTIAEVFEEKLLSEAWSSWSQRLLPDATINEKRLNFLSSGELRKLLLVNALSESPDLLILDNPYIGLDAASKTTIDNAIADIASKGMPVMLLLPDPADIPEATSCIIAMSDLNIVATFHPISAEETNELKDRITHDFCPTHLKPEEIPGRSKVTKSFETALELKQCNVKYGQRAVIEKESWLVRNGECWSLSGPNGCGKSVLLSLVYADNPQAYANDITIFDRRRGSGETIWDIKDRIGYVSPEMHLYFRSIGSVTDVVAQGVRSSVGCFGNIDSKAREEAVQWLRILGIEYAANKRYNTLSTGEQRLVLIARTLIKHPDLLILDEPLHGLDAPHKKLVIELIDYITRRDNTTLIFVTHCPDELPSCITHSKKLERH